MDAFRERLDLMQSTEQIGGRAREVTDAMVAEIDRRYGPLDEENAGMLVSHLALSLERLERGELLEPDPLVEAEAGQYPAELDAAAQLARLAERLGRGALPTGEVSFLAIHLRALVESREER